MVKDVISIEEMVNTCAKFSKISGIELNIQKTEIMKINELIHTPDYIVLQRGNNNCIIKTKESVKICGITFSPNTETAYEDNVNEKINKLERKLNIWRQRNLTMEGRNLIVKTHGISQLI